MYRKHAGRFTEYRPKTSNADLLQGVELHALEAEDVEQAHSALGLVLLTRDREVAVLHNVGKRRLEDRLDDGVAACHRLCRYRSLG